MGGDDIKFNESKYTNKSSYHSLNPYETDYNKDKDQYISLIENTDNMKVEDLYKSMSDTNNDNEINKEDQSKSLIDRDIIDEELINGNKIQNNKFHYSYK